MYICEYIYTHRKQPFRQRLHHQMKIESLLKHCNHKIDSKKNIQSRIYFILVADSFSFFNLRSLTY